MGLKVLVERRDAFSEAALLVRVRESELSVALAPAVDGDRVVYDCGLAKRTRQEARALGAKIVDEASRQRVERVAVELPALGDELIEEVVLGALLAGYRFDTYLATPRSDRFLVSAVELPSSQVPAEAFARGHAIAEAVALARDLINEPPSRMTPRRFAEIASEVAAARGLAIRVWDEHQCEEERLGGLLGVARGSVEPPRAIRIQWTPPGATKRIGLVGKGITFDSGGLSLKSNDGMMAMKTDMSGAAAVLAAVGLVAELGLPVAVSGYLMMTENMPSGSAQKPGDVLVTRSGRTIEVLNTDAEGRLVLADGLTLAEEDGNEEIVDIATLTGACVVALGDEVAGVMGNDEGLVAALVGAGEEALEPNWQLPLPASYESHITSEIADMKNMGKPGKAGAIAAALLLQRFVEHAKWAHLDIAGPSRADSDRGWIRSGGTGFGVLTFLRWLEAEATRS